VTHYVPGLGEKDPDKVIRSLMQAHENTATNTADIATNTASIATNTANIAKLSTNQFARVELITTAQTGLADSTYTKINFNNVSFDPLSIWVAADKQFKPTIAGYYRCSWSASLIVGSGNIVGVASLHKAGTLYTTGIFPGTVPGVVLSGNSAIVHMNGSTDVVDVRAFIGGSASRDIQARTDFTWFDIMLVKAD
jgi:hypothetical protein